MTVKQNHAYTEDRTVIGHVVAGCPVLQVHVLRLGLPRHARFYHTYISNHCQLFKNSGNTSSYDSVQSILFST